MTSFKNILASTDSGAYQVKVYDPVDKVVTVLVGSGQKGNEDGAAKSCTFVQPHGICTVEEAILERLSSTALRGLTSNGTAAKMTSEFVFFSSNPAINHLKIEKCLLLFATNTNSFTLLFKELKTDGESFIYAVCRLT